MPKPAGMPLVRCLAGDAQGLRNLLPGPPALDGKIDGLALHPIGEASQRDDSRQGRRRILRPGVDRFVHGSMLIPTGRSVNSG